MELNSFSQHSLEEDVAWLKSASEHIFFADLHIPLTAKMLKRALKTKLPRARVFHVTAPEYLDQMVKMQGKRKSISAATQLHPTVVTGGINTRGGLVFELKSDVLVSAPNDIMSRPDKTGRRWLEWYMLSTEGMINGQRVKNEIEKFGIKEKKKLILKYDPNAGRRGPISDNDVHGVWYRLNPRRSDSPIQKKIPFSVADSIPALRGMGGLEPSKRVLNIILRQMVKDYIDAMERVVAKYPKEIAALFFAHAQNAVKTSEGRDGWDELVVNNYEIREVLVHKPTIMEYYKRILGRDAERAAKRDGSSKTKVYYHHMEEMYDELIGKLQDKRLFYEEFENASDISKEVSVRSKLDFL